MADNPKIQRCKLHDYREPCIYHITVTTVDRKPLLGQVTGDVQVAKVVLTELGMAVRYEINMLPRRYPQIQVLQYIVMPDHVHLILRVKERLPEALPLGNIVAAWKHACGKAFASLAAVSDLKVAAHDGGAGHQQPLDGNVLGFSRPLGKEAFRSLPDTPSEEAALAPRHLRLFSEGYNDSILRGREQLQHMIAYVRDNPRRLLLKRANSPYFTIHRSIDIAGHRFDAIGNLTLLQRPLMAVHCRRRWTDEERQAFANRCMKASESGAVLIGAFISKTDQEIAHTANEHRHPLIHLVENGFPELYKPVGQAFYACAEGRLLLLAPWEYHAGRKVISREQCNALNTMAETIASQH